jgi:ketosteroid isomerase-like protein
MKQKTIIFLALTAMIGFSCSQNTDSNGNSKADDAGFDLDAMKKVIEDKTNQFTEAHITKDTTFLNNIFTKDARSFPPNAEAVVGRKAISQLNMDWINYGIYEAKEISTSFYGTKDYLIDEGTYIFIFGDEKTVDKGKYINIWKMEDDEWKLYSNIWNSSQPL